MKALLWIALGFVLVTWLLRNKKAASSSSGQASQPQPAPAEPMLQCRHCGIHVPASEAVIHADGSAFCSDEHQRLHFSS